jgi:transcriptional regulator with XRE-family HTH domain
MLHQMVSDHAERIGARIRERREELGLTRRDLIRQIDGIISDNDLYRWETGKHRPRDDTLTVIAEALGRDYAWAVGMPSGQPDEALAAPGQLDRIAAKLDETAERFAAFEEESRRRYVALAGLLDIVVRAVARFTDDEPTRAALDNARGLLDAIGMRSEPRSRHGEGHQGRAA